MCVIESEEEKELLLLSTGHESTHNERATEKDEEGERKKYTKYE